MIVAIHQPNFVPWLPFFAKMAEADVFVLLIHCQFEKNGYQNRFRVHQRWHTMPVARGLEEIWQKTYLEAASNWMRITKVFPVLEQFDGCISEDLAATNCEIIGRIARLLKIKTKIVLDEPTELTRTARLVDLCRRHKATVYLAGSSGLRYMEPSLFAAAGIEIGNQVLGDTRHVVEVLQ